MLKEMKSLVHDVQVKKKTKKEEQIRDKEEMKDRHKGRRDTIKEFLEEANTNCKLGGKELTERKKEKLWKGKNADYMTGLLSLY